MKKQCLTEKDIERDLGFNPQQIREIVNGLEKLKLVESKRIGNHIYYRLNHNNILKLTGN